MAEVLKLSKPIKISVADGDIEMKELPYDFDSLTAKDKLNAGKKMRAAGYAPTVEEIDTDYQLFLFAEAVCKADPKIDATDVMRISAKDAQKASSLARRFFYQNSAE